LGLSIDKRLGSASGGGAKGYSGGFTTGGEHFSGG
jgi:hypothetical protein